jgi:hypothetical protein
MSRTRARLVGAIAVLVVWLAAASPAVADVPPGFDLFETDPEATVFSFREEFTIPPNFFDQGSQPFQGDVNFGGVPLGTFMGRRTGDADTVVQRPTSAQLSPGQSAAIPIELVALSLQSIAPIEVQVGTTTQLWDVAAGLSQARQSRGGMVLTQQSAEGGTFDSELQVFPRFVFTRLTDRMTRVLDVGELPLSRESEQKLVLRALQVPWTPECVPPALRVLALNDGFCPSFTPAGDKVLSVEQAQLARHGVRPAQPRLEHFKCYSARSETPFRRRSVALRDQFGAHSARVVRPRQLCNPAQKNSEPFENRRAHLECYAIDRTSPAFSAQDVLIRNQFGPDRLRLGQPDGLCLPTAKSSVRRRPVPLGAENRIDHFRCFPARSASTFRARRVRLRDQFGRERVRVIVPNRLCAPVQKGRTEVEHPVAHLTCYRIREISGPTLPRRVRVRNQFRRTVVAAVKPQSLCVPSQKLRVGQP